MAASEWWAVWVAREKQDTEWDLLVLAKISAAEDTDRPYSRTAAGGTAYVSPRVAAERDLLDEVHELAVREDWARQRVADAGESWSTHMVKFDGTIVARRPWHNLLVIPSRKMDTPVGLFKAVCSCGYESRVDSETGAYKSGAQHVKAKSNQ